MTRAVQLEPYSKDGAAARTDACPQCHSEVPPGSKFCNQCGAQLALKSPPDTHARSSPHDTPARHTAHVQAPPAREHARKPVPDGARIGAHPHVAAPPPLHSKLRQCIDSIQGNKDIPAFSHHIMAVMSMMGNDEASLQNLTNVILRDCSITLAILRLANSAYYNRSGRTICSVARAVTMMGIDAIKRLTSGLMLLENYSKRSPGVKELLLLSLLTASHSHQAAHELKIKDADQVYLCGMFRNLGEVLIALFKNETYEAILREMQEHNMTAHDACLKILDFTYEDLGRAIAHIWNLPGMVSRAMEAANPASFAKQNDEDKIKTLVSFSHDLTHVVYRRSEEDQDQALENLLGKYSSIPHLDRNSLRRVMNEVVTRTKETFSTVGVPLNDLHLRNQHEAALSGAEQPRSDQRAALAAVTDHAHVEVAPAAPVQVAANEDVLAQIVAEIHAAVEPHHEPRLNEVLMMVLEACHRGAGFTRVVFCLATRDRTSVRGRIGLGPGIEAIVAMLQIPLSGHHEPLTHPLMSKRDLFINAELDDRYRDSPLVSQLAATCFGLFPIIVDDVVVGCLYFDKLIPNAVPAPKILDTIAGLRNVLAELIRRTRAHA